MAYKEGVEKALQMLKSLPRVSLGNLRPLRPQPSRRIRMGLHGGRKCGRGNKGQGQRNTLPRIGFEGGNTPFHLLIPKEPYYQSKSRWEYPPLSLYSLQRLIDLGRVDPNQPIDLSTLCNTKVIRVDPSKNHYGINLIDEGIDCFKSKVIIEVQRTNEFVIAAIEKNGGIITTRYFDPQSVEAMVDPELHFKKGLIVPRCKLPPDQLMEFYSDPNNRGYLANPQDIYRARFELSQKYGYSHCNLAKSNPFFKDPRQIWLGIRPGSFVNLMDKCIYKPTDQKLKQYYSS